MRIMTGDTRCRSGFDLMMGSKKARGLLLMTLRTEGAHCLQSQGRIVGTMRSMTDRAILSRGRV